ncbi:MAG: ABC transporter ATP-binding protein [Spongiibacteraceae bacterium]|jgi:ABC-2 type transport system ATP-binding protein|nr:ABC transporter ATP-binding protein [Spongiibacteraceae bacterium]
MTTALAIKGLTKVYNNGFAALKGIDLTVGQGDFFALLGPNGAGKSTTIGIICSLVRKSGGTVSVFGYDIDVDFPGAKRQLGVVPQEFNFHQFEKVIDIVTNQAGYYGLPRRLGLERAEKYLRQLGLWDKRNNAARMLSGGMKRRLMIARALVHEPRLLILDEPTAGVDIELRRSMWEFLREINQQGTTIILTTHYLEEAESLCRNIAIIDHGEIIENTSMKALLKTLHKEHFILDTREEVPAGLDLSPFDGHIIDPHSIQVEIEKGESLNELFSWLSGQGVTVTSMRNKANRLEELFVTLLAEKGTSPAAVAARAAGGQA